MKIVFLEADEEVTQLSQHKGIDYAFGSPNVKSTVCDVSNGTKVIQVPFADIGKAVNSAKSWADLEAELKSWF